MCTTEIAICDELTGEWQKRGITDHSGFSILTAEIAKATFGLTPSEYKKLKGLKRENLRDHMTGPRAVVPVHRLVWQTFRGDVPQAQRVTHENSDLLDHRLENLAPVTYPERLFRDGKLHPWPAGNPRARLTPEMHARTLATEDILTAGRIAKELGISIDAVHSIRQGRYRSIMSHIDVHS